jgi:hypothetical protein
MAKFDNIKVGDKVIYRPYYGNPKICTVTKVTPAGNFATDATGTSLYTKDGELRGGGAWSRDRMDVYTEQDAKTIEDCNTIVYAVKLMRNRPVSDVTIEQAKEIIRILGGDAK